MTDTPESENPMNRNTLTAAAIATVAASAAVAQNGPLSYPKTKKIEQTDTYHGVTVTDPYRWLEDDRSEETAAWVEAQNKVTFGYLEKIPYRAKILDRLKELYNYPRYSMPSRIGEEYLFRKNDGLQNQSVLYYQKGIEGQAEVLIDPNTLSPDGTVVLTGTARSRDGKYMAYGLSSGGSDWQEYRVMEVRGKKLLPDTLKWVKVSGIAWRGEGFYYSRYPEPEKGRELSSSNENHQIYYHRVGTPQSEDVLVYEDKSNPQRFHTLGVTEDERFAVLTISDRSKGKKGNALYFRDETKPEKTFTPIVAEVGDYRFGIIDNVGDKFLIQTDYRAPNGRVFLYDPQNPEEKNWKDVLPEKPEPLDGVGTAGGKLFAEYLKDVTSRVYVYSLDGKLENEVKLPGPGSVGGFGGREEDDFVFFSYTSFNEPTTIYRYDIKTHKVSLFRAPEIKNYRASDYEVKQVFYKSKDGTKIPAFIVHKKGLKRDGKNPTLLYGYGGFNVTLTPGFSALRIAWLEQGGVFVQTNLRGGGEYGEKWHEAGTKLQKQNVFDDFIAAAEYLIAEKYTSPSKLAIEGGSNGGLLVGAVINQRPDLFGAAVPAVGVMDMLRFHRFTIGWNWIADYGSSDNPEEFKALYAYSPIHNIKPGTKYPPTLITTADHDDRVVPAHSFKYAATLQEKQSGPAPVLIRIETKSGHGASNTTKALEEQADVYAFLFHSLGVTPK